MAEQQVLEDEVLGRACPGEDGRDQQPQQFKHALRIADVRSAEGFAAAQGHRAAGRQVQDGPVAAPVPA
jgi:hypothetical protein